MIAKSRVVEELARSLEQLCDEHGYLNELIATDAAAWSQAMIDAHLPSENQGDSDAERDDEADEREFRRHLESV